MAVAAEVLVDAKLPHPLEDDHRLGAVVEPRTVEVDDGSVDVERPPVESVAVVEHDAPAARAAGEAVHLPGRRDGVGEAQGAEIGVLAGPEGHAAAAEIGIAADLPGAATNDGGGGPVVVADIGEIRDRLVRGEA